MKTPPQCLSAQKNRESPSQELDAMNKETGQNPL